MCCAMPFAFIASTTYSHLYSRAMARWPRASHLFARLASVALCTLAIEVVLVACLGPVRCRSLLGPGFTAVHTALFLSGIPSLATVLVASRHRWLSEWFAVGSLCFAFVFFLILLQFHVAESLYGVNGTEGPFSY